MVNEQDERQVYELGYLLSPLFPADQAAEGVATVLKKPITALGGEVGDELTGPKMVRLAYPIKKMVENKNQTFKDAYFGSFKFALDAQAAPALKDALTLADQVVRFIILKMPRGVLLNNPIQVEPAEPVEPAAAAPLTTEQLDREIEDLLV